MLKKVILKMRAVLTKTRSETIQTQESLSQILFHAKLNWINAQAV